MNVLHGSTAINDNEERHYRIRNIEFVCIERERLAKRTSPYAIWTGFVRLMVVVTYVIWQFSKPKTQQYQHT